MAQTAKGPRETRTGKKEWQRMTFKNGRTGFRPNRKERNTPEMRIPRRAYLSTSQRGWPTRSFRRNQNQEKERMRKNGKGTYRGDRDRTCSVCKRTKQGNPGHPEKLHYKRRGRVVKKAARKKKKKHTKKRRNSLGRTIRKIHPERKY